MTGQASITEFMNQALADKVFPGAVLLCAKGDQLLFHKGFGMADLFEQTLVDQDTVFDLASLTKPLVTGLCTASLIADNRLDFHYTLDTLLAAFHGTDKAKITIDMLLRHRSGLPAYKAYFKEIGSGGKDARKQLRNRLVNEPLIHEPGGEQVYSDLGFMILAWVIENICQERLDMVFYNRVRNPLSIKSLFYIPIKERQIILKDHPCTIAATRRCPWRNKLVVAEVEDENAWAAGGVEGHAGLFGTAGAVWQLCVEILHAVTHCDTALPAEVIRRMVQRTERQPMVAGFDTPSKTNSAAGDYFSAGTIGHLGFTGTSFWIDPETSLIVVFLSNRVHPSRSNEKIKAFRPRLHNLICRQLM